MSIKQKMKDFWRYYVLGYYHCDRCPYSWEERDYEGDADGGCIYRKDGELMDTCRHIRNPISDLIVKRRRNLQNASFDGWEEYGRMYESAAEIKKEIDEWIERDIFGFFEGEWENAFPKIPERGEMIFYIIQRYESKEHPYRSEWETLKDAFRNWIKWFWWYYVASFFKGEKR